MTIIKNNQGFTCIHCKKEIPQAKKTCRNHCPYCFTSQHVDMIPGDRASPCQGMMVPISYTLAHGTIKITFSCQSCGHTHNNKVASDDEITQLDGSISFRKERGL